MSLKILWFIPTHGDSRYLGCFKQVAVDADTLGYEGLLTSTGRSCEGPWTVATSLSTPPGALNSSSRCVPG